jgi:hypothetical protein
MVSEMTENQSSQLYPYFSSLFSHSSILISLFLLFLFILFLFIWWLSPYLLNHGGVTEVHLRCCDSHLRCCNSHLRARMSKRTKRNILEGPLIIGPSIFALFCMRSPTVLLFYVSEICDLFQNRYCFTWCKHLNTVKLTILLFYHTVY